MRNNAVVTSALERLASAEHWWLLKCSEEARFLNIIKDLRLVGITNFQGPFRPLNWPSDNFRWAENFPCHEGKFLNNMACATAQGLLQCVFPGLG